MDRLGRVVAAEAYEKLARSLYPEGNLRKTLHRLEAEAGLKPNALTWRLKPSVELEQIPTQPNVAELAEAMKCPEGKLTMALLKDANYVLDLPSDLTEDESDVVGLWRHLNPRDRETVHAMMLWLVQRQGDK